MKNKTLKHILFGALIILINIVSSFYFVRVDFTADKRYTLTKQSKQLVQTLDKPLEVILYLNGELNPAFDRLRTSTTDLLDELSIYTPKGIIFHAINPSIAPNEKAREAHYLAMDKKGMRGLSVNEHDREGKLSSKVVFPWMEIVYNGDTIPVSLLKKNVNLTPQEVINTSTGELEYGVTEAIRTLTITNPSRIAFIEGHGEWSEAYTYEATNLLSRFYTIDRGTINGNPEELLPYKVVIIASPRSAFSEKEKFALDQYVMHGGSILWLVDGVKISQREFDATGESSTLKQELNLDDMLFTYGVRINPVSVQDMQCTAIRLASSTSGTKEDYTTLPWYFAPLLTPTNNHPITRNLSPLKSEMVSTLSFVGNSELKKQVLLTTSVNAHTLRVPEKISLRYVEMPAEPSYFNESSLPIGGLIEGRFLSVFKNRLLPEGCKELSEGRLQMSKPTRMIVVSTGSIIKNEWNGQGENSTPIPLGFDVLSGEQLGNSTFLINAINYLAGNGSWLELRRSDIQLRLLDKQEIYQKRQIYQFVNIILPHILLLGIYWGLLNYRKRKNS